MNLRQSEGTQRCRNQAAPSAVKGRLLSADSSLLSFSVSYGRQSDAGYALLSLYYIICIHSHWVSFLSEDISLFLWIVYCFLVVYAVRY